MGVPAFFHWLSVRYPRIVVKAEDGQDNSNKENKPDATQPNVNFQEFDNLYLDMNGIIHPCTHPSDRPPPQTEDEMFALIFEYIDEVFDIVRPRKLLYMAIDGVAPRAKMNQQRSRRFRSSGDEIAKQFRIEEKRKSLEKAGRVLPPAPENPFDSNCITPGTPFMTRLAVALRFYIHDRISTSPAWADIQVILSDASVPGEGEHKIMDFVRRQRSNPDYNPDVVHCLCGADADLIMLGLATHETNFNIIREAFIRNKPQPCELCHQFGHELDDCRGLDRKLGTVTALPVKQRNSFVFVRLPVLREYLERDLRVNNTSFEYDFETALDDWIFLCFFVGNDFLPSLPAFEIREDAIERIMQLYRASIAKMDGYLTSGGNLVIDRIQVLLTGLGRLEDELYKERKDNEVSQNEKAAQRLKGKRAQPTRTVKSAVPLQNEGSWKDQYYRKKFDVTPNGEAFRNKVAQDYARGLNWVFLYYYKGCPNWDWYFPYHYAPCASDFKDLASHKLQFSDSTKPLKPLEQLMAVFPPASRKHLPEDWQQLMTSKNSPLIHMYPTKFRVDLNGKRFAWQGVALLPFVDKKLLLHELEKVYPSLTPEEITRNSVGTEHIFFHSNGPMLAVYKKCGTGDFVDIDSKLSHGLAGRASLSDVAVPAGTKYPSPVKSCQLLKNNKASVMNYEAPKFPDGYKFPSALHLKARELPRILSLEDQPITLRRNKGKSPHFPAKKVTTSTILAASKVKKPLTSKPAVVKTPKKNQVVGGRFAALLSEEE